MTEQIPPQEVTKLIKIVRHVRYVGEIKKPDGKGVDLMTPQALHMILEIALQPGITLKQLSVATGLSPASVSRNLMVLGERHRNDTPGLDLIVTVDDPEEVRRKLAFLKEKGRKFVSDLTSIQAGK